MAFDILFFSFSLLACAVIFYILTMLWFSNARSSQLKSFLMFGGAVGVWLLFSAIASIAAPQHFTMLYTVHAVTGCVFPYVFLWYALNYCNSKLTRIKPFIFILCAIPLLDAAAFATNPLHRLMFLTYDYPDLPTGPLFWIHAIFSYIAFLGALITIFAHIFRRARKTPMVIITAFGTLLPFVINLLLALNLLGTRRDFTSVGFFITFALFFLTTYRSGPFSFKSIALTNIFTSLSDVILISNARGVVVDSNTAFRGSFPEFPLTVGKTTVTEFMAWLSPRVFSCQPENLLLGIDDIGTLHENGEFSVLNNGYSTLPDNVSNIGEIRTFTLHRDLIQHKKKPSGFLITMSDVSAYRAMISEINQQNEHLTELKELAEQTSKTKSSFLANMSHEIRTPINAITGMAAIARGTDDLEKIHDCMNKVDAASRQLLGIINDILDMSKIEANRMELASEVFELPAMILNIKSIIEITASAKGQKLEVLISENLPQAVVGDDMRLSQILLNLLSNAVKFTPNNGNISLSAKLLETKDDIHFLEIAVKDDGIGMTAEQQNRLFQSFEQADKSISKRYGGSGLGLVISRGLAELMDGGITLESEFGKGSCFTVRFCLRVGDKDFIAQNAAAQSYDFNGLTALLAEDIEINREIVTTMLEGVGIRVDCAEDGQQAVDIFLAAPKLYDIIFMDIHMPVMDGYSATRLIRASEAPNAADIPIMAMTANAFSEDVENCRNAGMNDHISKPIEFDLLFKKMALLIGK